MQFQNFNEKIIIIDFGSQVTKLIARRVRDFGVFSEIIRISDLHNIKNYKEIKGIILSGGPSTVTKNQFQSIPKEILLKKIPSGGEINRLIVLSTIFHSVKGIPLSKSTFSSGCSQS